MQADRSYIAVGELRKVKYLRICHLDWFRIAPGVLFDFAPPDFGIAGSESSVKDVIHFVLAESYNILWHVGVVLLMASRTRVRFRDIERLSSAELSERSGNWLYYLGIGVGEREPGLGILETLA